MTSDHTPWEVGLGWTVDPNKLSFRGKETVLASKGKERFKFGGIVVEYHDSLVGEEQILSENKEVIGTVNSPCWSERMQQSLVLVHIKKGYEPESVN